MSSSIKRTALTLGGIFIRSSSRVLNEILGGNPPAGPDLNAHFNTTQREYDEYRRMIEADTTRPYNVKAAADALPEENKLGKFLAEDPFGAAGKIDKFCTYLENNGPAALHVAGGKDVDLERLFRKVVG